MKTICVTAQKGGAGKTTLARNLAVAAAQDGRKVLMIDLDPQQSLRLWWRARESEQPTMLENDPHPQELRSTLEAAHGKVDLTIIDTPPAAPTWLSTVLGASDLALVPVRPSPDDLRAVGATIGALRDTRTAFAFIMSQTPRAKITAEAARVLAQHGRVAPINIAQRIIFAETAASGLGVTEATDERAAAEIAEIWSYVEGVLEW